MLKIINILIKRVTGGSFAYPSASDPIWVATEKSNKKNILGICMISKKSPDKHFDNEHNSVKSSIFI